MQQIQRQSPALAPLLTMSLLFLLTGFFWPAETQARDNPANVCDQATRTIAKETNVPLDVLQTIARVDGTIRPLASWPWTIKLNGKGVWFDTENQARVYVFRHFRKGVRNFAIGCFQINYELHGQEFSSIEEMFDPISNARYVANYLTQLHAKHGDWAKAARAYQSGPSKLGTGARIGFAKVDASLEPTAATAVAIQDPQTLPSASRSDKRSAGSLVPTSPRAASSILQHDHEG